MKLSIIIVNYNVKEYLANCLIALTKACEKIDAEIFVVDNGSNDGSRDFLENKFQNVHFKWNEANLGFAKANNSVLNNLSGEYILFLNPDTIIPEDSLLKCLDFFKDHKDCGGLGVYMQDGAGRFLKESKRGFPSPITAVYKFLGLSKIFPQSKTFAKYYEGHLDKNNYQTVDVLSGAFMMVPKVVIQKTGGFDEAYFMYGEDIELSYQINLLGYKNYYYPDVKIIHFKNKSATQNLTASKKHFFNAMKVFVRKRYSSKVVKKLILLTSIQIIQFVTLVKIKLFNR